MRRKRVNYQINYSRSHFLEISIFDINRTYFIWFIIIDNAVIYITLVPIKIELLCFKQVSKKTFSPSVLCWTNMEEPLFYNTIRDSFSFCIIVLKSNMSNCRYLLIIFLCTVGTTKSTSVSQIWDIFYKNCSSPIIMSHTSNTF